MDSDSSDKPPKMKRSVQEWRTKKSSEIESLNVKLRELKEESEKKERHIIFLEAFQAKQSDCNGFDFPEFEERRMEAFNEQKEDIVNWTKELEKDKLKSKRPGRYEDIQKELVKCYEAYIKSLVKILDMQ